MALQKHPDKNPDNPRAAEEFAIIQKAYDILCDKEAREALDDWIRCVVMFLVCFSQESCSCLLGVCVYRCYLQYQLFSCRLQEQKAQRTLFRDEKRRRMAEDLERREKEADGKVGAEVAAKERLQQQIERLRRAAAEREELLHRQKQMNIHTSVSKEETENKQDDERLSRTVKVNWDPEEVQLDETSLRHMLMNIGATVEDVVVRRSKKRKKEYNSALVVMGSAEDCTQSVTKLQGQRGLQIRTLAVDSATVEKPSTTAAAAADTVSVARRSGGDDSGSRKEGKRAPLFPAAKSTIENRQGIPKVEDANVSQSSSFEQQVLAQMMRPGT